MAGGEIIRADGLGKAQEGIEFDFTVAQHIRVGRAVLFIFLQKMREHLVPIFARIIDGIIWDADQVAHMAHVRPVLFRGAYAHLVLFFPVFHKHAGHIVPLALEQQRGDGGIHPAGHAHNDLCHGLNAPSA